MILHGPNDVTSSRHVPSWALLAFAAGAVNAGALLACERFVSHVTGTLTRVGTSDGLTLALDYLLVVLCFLTGAISAVLLTRKVSAGGVPLYWPPLVVVAGLVASVAVLGHAGVFGPFGGSVETPRDFGLLAVLSFAMGMQNAAVAASTGMAVRTTHMTGPATDFAIAIATLIDGSSAERPGAKRSAILRGTKLAAFVTGGVAMVPIATRVGFACFVVPAVACLVATALSYAPRRIGQVNA